MLYILMMLLVLSGQLAYSSDNDCRYVFRKGAISRFFVPREERLTERREVREERLRERREVRNEGQNKIVPALQISRKNTISLTPVAPTQAVPTTVKRNGYIPGD